MRCSRSVESARWALALDDLVAQHIAPFYQDQAAIDFARLTMLRHAVFGAPAPDPQPAHRDRVTFAQLSTAASADPTAFRAFRKMMAMFCLPEEVYTDPQVVSCTREILRPRGSEPPATQPPRELLLDALAT